MRRQGHGAGSLPEPAGRELLGSVGDFDSLVCAAGKAAFSPLNELSEDDVDRSLHNKLRGQVELARLALERVSDDGSVTLTSGVLATEPSPGSAAISMSCGRRGDEW